MNRLDVINKYMGLEEKKDREKLKKLLGIDPYTTAWCAAFANAIEKECGAKGTGKLTARSFLNYGIEVKTPQPGDIVVFKRGSSSWQGHVSYFVKDQGPYLIVRGGNQSNKVCDKAYRKSDVLGYRRSQ